MIKVALMRDNTIEESDEFTSPEKAEAYFFKQARKRTRHPSIIMTTVDGDIRMLYHIDDAYAANRWQISLDLVTGLPVKRRYIPSSDELTGRKSQHRGHRLPPIIIPLELHARLQERAHRTGVPIAELRKRAYEKILDEDDTMLFEALK